MYQHQHQHFILRSVAGKSCVRLFTSYEVSMLSCDTFCPSSSSLPSSTRSSSITRRSLRSSSPASLSRSQSEHCFSTTTRCNRKCSRMMSSQPGTEQELFREEIRLLVSAFREARRGVELKGSATATHLHPTCDQNHS